MKSDVREAIRVALLTLINNREDSQEPHEYGEWETCNIFNQAIEAMHFVTTEHDVRAQSLIVSTEQVPTNTADCHIGGYSRHGSATSLLVCRTSPSLLLNVTATTTRDDICLCNKRTAALHTYVLSCTTQVFAQFLSTSMNVLWSRGHSCMLPDVDPDLSDVYGERAELVFLEQARIPRYVDARTFASLGTRRFDGAGNDAFCVDSLGL